MSMEEQQKIQEIIYIFDYLIKQEVVDTFKE